MDAAKKVAANPDDAAAQAELSQAQQGLQKAIQKLVVLTGKDEKSRKELEDALKGKSNDQCTCLYLLLTTFA